MYVIATVFCSNFHFSVSLHVPFSQFLFERDSYSSEYSNYYLVFNYTAQAYGSRGDCGPGYIWLASWVWVFKSLRRF